MYTKGEYIVHPGQGVCEVLDITSGDKAVYKLLPLTQTRPLVISFPVASEGRLRPVLSREEALEIIESYPSIELDDFTDHSGAVEEDYFKTQMKEGTCSDSVRIVKTFRHRIARAREDKRKPPVVYERILREASTRSLGELAVALGSTPEAVKELFEQPGTTE